MANPKDATAPVADLVSADLAAVAAAESGASDELIWATRIAELDAIRDRRITLATIAMSASRQSADVWGLATKKGAGILETAEKAYKTATDEAAAMYADGIASFAAQNPQFASRVPSELRSSVVARLMLKHFAPVFNAISNLDAASVATIDLGNGTVANVLEVTEWLRKMVKGSGSGVDSDGASESETVEAIAASE